MKDKLIIVGAKGHGKVVADIALKMKKWKRIEFLDDDESLCNSIGLEVVGTTSDISLYKYEADFFVAIGNNLVREKLLIKLENLGCSISTLIHPEIIIGRNVIIEAGSVVMAGVVLNSATRIGKGCIINTSSSLDHDNFIDDYVHVSPGVRSAGTVKVGKSTWIGIGCVISNNLNVASNCIIGAGSVVIKDIIEPGTYVGVPARRISD